MEWSDDIVKDLISAYYEKRILWDPSHNDYNHNRLKAKVWEELSKTFNCSVKDLKDKVKNLRTTFHRVRRKNWKKISSGSEPEWKFFSALAFLTEIDLLREGLSTEAEEISDPVSFFY